MLKTDKKNPDLSINNSPVSTSETSQPWPSYMLKDRYENLNNAQKKIVVNAYLSAFNVMPQAFYHTLRNAHFLTDRQLFFFAGIFECSILDLYSEPPTETPSVFLLYRKAKGVKPGKQIGLPV